MSRIIQIVGRCSTFGGHEGGAIVLALKVESGLSIPQGAKIIGLDGKSHA